MRGEGTARATEGNRTDVPGGRRASSALGWSFLNTAAGKLGTLAIGVVLARVLGPEEFGTYAVAYVALLAVLAFNELGVSLAIVRWPVDPAVIAPTVTTISVATSVLIAAGTFVAAPAFATAMGDPGATTAVRLLGLCVVVNGLVAVPAALLQRYFRQDRRMIADQVNVWLGAVVSLVLALAGTGAMALVVGRIAGATVSGVLLLFLSPARLRFGLDRTHIRPLLAFGLPLAGASVIVFASGYVDQLVVGAVLGPVALGYYVLAFNLASWPVAMLSQPVRSVAPALFANLQEDRVRMAAAMGGLLRPLAAVALPGCAVLAVAAEDVVGLVYGEQWLPAAQALRWLALLAAMRIMFELSYDYLVVCGRTGRLLAVQALWFVALLPAVVLGARAWGTGGVGAAQVIVAVAVVAPAYLLLVRGAGLSVRALLGDLTLPATAAVIAAGAALLVGRAGGDQLLTLLGVGAVAVAAAAPLLWLRRGDLAALHAARAGVAAA